MMKRRSFLAAALAACLATGTLPALTRAQQTGGKTEPRQKSVTFDFDNQNPAYAAGEGPSIAIHRYVSPYVQREAFVPFQELAETDGFKVDWLDRQISAEILAEIDILVVANAYIRGGALDYRNFSTLEQPSVYSDAEIALIVDWVRKGGSLFISADHSPFAGGALKLAEALGFVFMTGFALHGTSTSDGIKTNIDFRRDGEGEQIGRLASHPITDGELGRKRVSHFFAFGGQAIIPPPEAVNLLTIPEGFETILTFALQRDFFSAPRLDASNLSQGAVMVLGEGRIAIFGETGAFTAQSIDGRPPFGMIAPEADENAEFALSTLRWLAKYQP